MKNKILILENTPVYFWYFEKTAKYLIDKFGFEIYLYSESLSLYNEPIFNREFIRNEAISWGVNIIKDLNELKNNNFSSIITSYVHFYNSPVLKYFYNLSVPIIQLPHGFQVCYHCHSFSTLHGCDCWSNNVDFLTYIPVPSRKIKKICSKHRGIEVERIVPIGSLELDFYLNRKKDRLKNNSKKKILIFLRYEIPSFIKTNNQYLNNFFTKLNDLMKSKDLKDHEIIIKPHPIDLDFSAKYKFDFPYKVLREPWWNNLAADIYDYTPNIADKVDFIITSDSSVLVYMLALNKKILMPINPDIPYNKKLMRFYKDHIFFWSGNKTKNKEILEFFNKEKKLILNGEIRDYIDDYWDAKSYKRFGDFVFEISIRKRSNSLNINADDRLKERYETYPKNQIVLFQIAKKAMIKGVFPEFINKLRNFNKWKDINPLLGYLILKNQIYFSDKFISNVKTKLLKNLTINIQISLRLLDDNFNFVFELFKKIRNLNHGMIGWLDDMIIYLLPNRKIKPFMINKIKNRLLKAGLFKHYETYIEFLINKNYFKDLNENDLIELLKKNSQTFFNKARLKKFLLFVVTHNINNKRFKIAELLLNVSFKIFNDVEFYRILFLLTIETIKMRDFRFKIVSEIESVYEKFSFDYQISFYYGYIKYLTKEFKKSENIFENLLKDPFCSFQIKWDSFMMLGQIRSKGEKWLNSVANFMDKYSKEITYFQKTEIAKRLFNLGDEKRSILLFENILDQEYLNIEIIEMILKFLISKEIVVNFNYYALKKKIDLIKNMEKSNTLYYCLYFYLGMKYRKIGLKKYKYYFKKAINVLSKKRRKTPIDYYHLASLYKKNDDYLRSEKLFKIVLSKKANNTLKSGAYFHLGEIKLSEGNKNKALEYFRKCMEYNPNHKKAREYLDNEKQNLDS